MHISKSSLFLSFDLFIKIYNCAAAAARVEAERSCAVRNSHFHHQSHQHVSVGGSTGLSWLGTSAPKSSVFAPLSGTSNSSSQSNPWNGQVDKSPSEPSNRFPISGSPAKLEVSSARSSSEQVTSSIDRSENLETTSRNSSVSITSGGASVSDSAPTATQSNFHGFTNPATKEERENGSLPLTPTSGPSTSSSGHQHQTTLGDSQRSSEQPSSSSLNSGQLPQSQSIPNTQLYQQPNMDMKQEMILASTSSTILPYSHAYMAAGVGSYGGALSSYPPPHDNKTSLSLYSSKNKAKNRSSTGWFNLFSLFVYFIFFFTDTSLFITLC